MTKRKQYRLQQEILESFIPQWVKDITGTKNKKGKN